MQSRSSFIRRAVLDKLEELEAEGIMEVRETTLEEAMKLIDTYLKRHPGTHHASDFIEKLGIEPEIAFTTAQKLIDEGRARLGRD